MRTWEPSGNGQVFDFLPPGSNRQSLAEVDYKVTPLIQGAARV